MSRALHLNAFLKPPGEYLAAWRHPDAVPDAGVNLPHLIELVRTAERAPSAREPAPVGDAAMVPLVGRIAAGIPITAEQQIDEVFPLSAARAAFEHVQGSHGAGKVVLRVVDQDS